MLALQANQTVLVAVQSASATQKLQLYMLVLLLCKQENKKTTVNKSTYKNLRRNILLCKSTN
jgi:hypothetical protein